MAGKLSLEELKRLLSMLPTEGEGVVLGPRVGEDAAVLDPGGRLVVVHSDPVTEAVSEVGWIAVHVAANDVAVTGARPMWALVTILLPEGHTGLWEIAEGISRAAEELGMAVVGGHTEEAPGVEKPIVVVTAMGLAESGRIVRTSGARPGDLIVMSGSAGLEGTAIIARDFADALRERGVDEAVLEKAREFLSKISVVREALRIAPIATSMHDPTEGGVVGGLVEMALASRKKFVVDAEKILIADETRIICGALSIDPLMLISSGVLIATIPRNSVIPEGFQMIGEVRVGKPSLELRREGEIETYVDVPKDELARLWESGF